MRINPAFLFMEGGERDKMRKQTLRLFSAILLCAILFPMSGYAVETAPRISDREIIESLTRLEEGVKANRRMIESLRSDVGTLRSELLSFMKWGFGLILSGMLILVGFILWDRRSTVKPVRDQIDELERQKVDRLIAAMKELSATDANLARVLRSVGLL